MRIVGEVASGWTEELDYMVTGPTDKASKEYKWNAKLDTVIGSTGDFVKSMDHLESKVSRFAKIGGRAGAELLDVAEESSAYETKSFKELRQENKEMQYARAPCHDKKVKLPKIPGMTLPSQREVESKSTPPNEESLTSKSAKDRQESAKAEVESTLRTLINVTDTDPRSFVLSNGFTPQQAIHLANAASSAKDSLLLQHVMSPGDIELARMMQERSPPVFDEAQVHPAPSTHTQPSLPNCSTLSSRDTFGTRPAHSGGKNSRPSQM